MRNSLSEEIAAADFWGADPDSPAGRHFDWSAHGLPHPDAPAGRNFDWTGLNLPHLMFHTGLHCNFGIAASDPIDPAIEALHLASKARDAAYKLKRLFPAVKFTSGRRDKAAQASAMASNVVLKRKFIQNTYKPSAARDACQKWVDDNPDKKTKAEISTGLKTVLDGLTDDQLAHLSKHLSGMAFDVQPVKKDAAKIKATLRRLAGRKNFLERESGLVRWHAQFQLP